MVMVKEPNYRLPEYTVRTQNCNETRQLMSYHYKIMVGLNLRILHKMCQMNARWH